MSTITTRVQAADSVLKHTYTLNTARINKQESSLESKIVNKDCGRKKLLTHTHHLLFISHYIILHIHGNDFEMMRLKLNYS